MKMDKKMKQCFSPHVVMHSIFGLGLGLLLAALIPSLAQAWLGVVLILAAIGADIMRKS